jgi:hypothetical protein
MVCVQGIAIFVTVVALVLQYMWRFVCVRPAPRMQHATWLLFAVYPDFEALRLLHGRACFIVHRPFWDPRIDNLDCICCASLLLHAIASLLYNNRDFTKSELDPTQTSTGATSLETAMICVNALTLLAILGQFLTEFAEHKLKLHAVRTVVKTVTRLVVRLQQDLQENRLTFLAALETARNAPPELEVGSFVQHAEHGDGKCKDILCADDGTKIFVILFGSGDRHHYTELSAQRKLVLLKSAFCEHRDPVPLSLLLAATKALTITVNPKLIEALFIILKAIEGKEGNYDVHAPVSKDLVFAPIVHCIPQTRRGFGIE